MAEHFITVLMSTVWGADQAESLCVSWGAGRAAEETRIERWEKETQLLFVLITSYSRVLTDSWITFGETLPSLQF